MKSIVLAVPAMERCKRKGTPNWQCPLRAIPGKSYCEKHYQYAVSRRKRPRITVPVGGGISSAKCDFASPVSVVSCWQRPRITFSGGGGISSGKCDFASPASAAVIEPYRPVLNFGATEVGSGCLLEESIVDEELMSWWLEHYRFYPIGPNGVIGGFYGSFDGGLGNDGFPRGELGSGSGNNAFGHGDMVQMEGENGGDVKGNDGFASSELGSGSEKNTSVSIEMVIMEGQNGGNGKGNEGFVVAELDSGSKNKAFVRDEMIKMEEQNGKVRFDEKENDTGTEAKAGVGGVDQVASKGVKRKRGWPFDFVTTKENNSKL